MTSRREHVTLLRERSVWRGLAAAAMGAVITLVAVSALRGHSAITSGSGVAWIVAIGFFVAFEVGVLVGLPAHLMFRRFGVKGPCPVPSCGAGRGSKSRTLALLLLPLPTQPEMGHA